VASTNSGFDGRRTATLRDVAALAGVSIATASKALNGRDQVHPETRERVIAAAAKVAFRPNPMAQGLLRGQTGTVGLLTDDLVGRFSLPILMGAEDEFGSGSVSVFLADARGDAIRQRHHLHAFLDRRVDGLIAVASNTDPRPTLGRELPIPVIYAYGPSVHADDTSLVPDNVSAGEIAVEHLLTTGRRHLALISGDEAYLAARDRTEGVQRAVAAAGISLVEPVMYGSWSEGWGRTATRALVDRVPELDGIICASDQIARGSLDALRDLGVPVPERVAVLGFDNWEAVVADSRPPLTSVDMNFEALGRAAAQRLTSAMSGERHAGGVEKLPVRLVARASTARV
jgi:LacI family transcriptional regulator